MRIAQVSPLYESVPPKLYGGTERVVAYLSDALVELGHEVTLFASGDSESKARLIPVCDKALRLDPEVVDPLAYHFIQLQVLIERIKDFDFIHFHTDYLHFPFSNKLNIPYATTLHGRLNLPELKKMYRKFNKQPVISISNNQRIPLPHANWVGTVYHGLPLNLLNAGHGKGGYLAFLGRVSPEKRLDRAIRMAIRANMPLRIAAKVDKADLDYFEKEIKPMLDYPLIEFIGEINEKYKQDFLGNAACLLFPIDWPEPFGLVMIEAMACGTPVIAFRHGSVPEVLTDGVTGYIVDSEEEGVEAISKALDLERSSIRTVFEKRFSSSVMASNYVRVYEELKSRSVLPMTSAAEERKFIRAIK